VIPNEKVIKIATGFHHTMYLTAKSSIYCHGLNNNGQCGTSNLSGEHIVIFLFNKNKYFLNLDQLSQ